MKAENIPVLAEVMRKVHDGEKVEENDIGE